MGIDLGLTGIDRATFAVGELATAVRYLEDWGLERRSLDEARALYAAVDGSEVELVRADPRDPSRRAIGDESGLCRITFGVRAGARLEPIGEELSRDREVVREPDGGLRTVDDLGFQVAFRPSRRAAVGGEPTAYNAPGQPARIDRRAVRYERARPHEISHLALSVDDAAAAARFYTERLGFRVSDRYADRGLFLRCAPAGNHHHLFLMNGARPGARFNHLAFKVRDVHEVILGGQAFDARGWETFAGPGRHQVSSACFWYFKTPFGGAFEYAADEDMVTEAWQPTDFAAEAHIFSQWTFGLERSDGRLRGPISQSKAR